MNHPERGSHFVGIYPGRFIVRKVGYSRLVDIRSVNHPLRKDIAPFKKIFQFHLVLRRPGACSFFFLI